MRILHDGRAVIVGLEKLDLNEFPTLEAVGCNMTSTEHLPLQEMEQRGIKLISLKGETKFLQTITSTAEHTIGLIVALMRNYKAALNGPYDGRERYKGFRLKSKHLGIIGLGRIGQQVKKTALALGMAVHDYDKNQQGVADLGEHLLLPSCDIVSIHIPLSGNEGFFTQAMFEQMKPSAYLINTSRPGIVEKGALLWALENKKIAGAAVDFVDDDELVRYAERSDNLILTPHLGGCTVEDMSATEKFIEQKVEEYIKQNAKN